MNVLCNQEMGTLCKALDIEDMCNGTAGNNHKSQKLGGIKFCKQMQAVRSVCIIPAGGQG